MSGLKNIGPKGEGIVLIFILYFFFFNVYVLMLKRGWPQTLETDREIKYKGVLTDSVLLLYEAGRKIIQIDTKHSGKVCFHGSSIEKHLHHS